MVDRIPGPERAHRGHTPATRQMHVEPVRHNREAVSHTSGLKNVKPIKHDT